MSTQSSSTNTAVEKVKAITDALESTRDRKPTSMVRAFRKNARFAWHVWLGTAVTLEEKVVELTRDFAKKGESAESQARTALRERASNAKRATIGMGRHAPGRASGVESAIYSGVNRSLHLLGVPSRQDIVQLERLMEDMSATVTELVGQTRSSIEDEKKSTTSKTPKVS